MANDEAAVALKGGIQSWDAFANAHPNLESYDFSGVDFRRTNFGDKATAFQRPVNFTKCQFGEWPFPRFAFRQGANFTEATFESVTTIQAQDQSNHSLKFVSTTFNQHIHVQLVGYPLEFRKCKFLAGLSLHNTFEKEIFCGEGTEVYGRLKVGGDRRLFVQSASFNGLKLVASEDQVISDKAELDFRRVTFAASADLRNMDVAGVARFDSEDTKFCGSTNFQGTVFRIAPAFHGAKLSRETAFAPVSEFDKQFPDVSSEWAEKRYQVLKNYMADQQAISEQLAFFRLEMKAHTKKLKSVGLHHFYGWFSDFGFSWLRPAIVLAGMTLVFWIMYFALSTKSTHWSSPILSSIAIGNAVPFVGNVKSLFSGELKSIFLAHHFGVPTLLIVQVLSVLQGIVSAVLLFLVALGVRNKLRMK